MQALRLYYFTITVNYYEADFAVLNRFFLSVRFEINTHLNIGDI